MRIPALAIAVSFLIVSTAGAQSGGLQLTPADVEQATGVSPLHMVQPGAQPGAGPGLNFATADNKLLVMVNTGPDALYTRAKTQKEAEFGGMKVPMVLFHAALPGIGDEAFDSPPGDQQYVIYLRKGSKGATVNTYLDHGKPRLTMDQLKALAKLVATRL